MGSSSKAKVSAPKLFSSLMKVLALLAAPDLNLHLSLYLLKELATDSPISEVQTPKPHSEASTLQS